MLFMNSFIRRRLKTVIAVALAGTFMAAGSASAQQALSIRIGQNIAVGTPLDLGVKRFAQLVEERSGGKIKVQDYPAGQLGNEQQMIEGMQIGTLDMAAITGSTYGNVLPEANVLGMLYAFRDPAHMRRALEGPVGDELAAALLKKTGIHIVSSSWYYGTRQLTSNKPVETPADLEGMKLRVVPVPIFEAYWRAMGATPTPVDFKDLFTALQTHVVDAQENPLATMKGAGVQLVNKYLTLTDHLVSNVIVGMSDDLHSRLSPEQLELVKTAVRDAGIYQDELVVKSETDLLAELKAGGMTVIHPDKALFREKVKDVPNTFEGGLLADLYNKIQAVQ
ncbi:TRAP transporter substrate-binding protein [Castellaniella sp. GW247-6E4]|uniref:TRAP transporter substrate-binding protein n=1 Tax=Castellaniella sp. GW247-6E4 TaxID=3140380 RepID=UPI0033145943